MQKEHFDHVSFFKVFFNLTPATQMIPDPCVPESATPDLYTHGYALIALPLLLGAVRKPLSVCSIEGKEKKKDLKGYLQEVLQFCDFFSAIMSFWVTIISMAKLPDKLVNFLHMLGRCIP
jgi:hypothetical protein